MQYDHERRRPAPNPIALLFWASIFVIYLLLGN